MVSRGRGHRRHEAVKALDILNQGAWCVVSDMTGRVLSWIEIGTMPDWRIRFAEMVQAASAAEWVLEEEHPTYSYFYCHRDGKRILVHLQPTPPRNPLGEWLLPAPSASIQECLRLFAQVP
jgi:hypothetical protein